MPATGTLLLGLVWSATGFLESMPAIGTILSSTLMPAQAVMSGPFQGQDLQCACYRH